MAVALATDGGMDIIIFRLLLKTTSSCPNPKKSCYATTFREPLGVFTKKRCLFLTPKTHSQKVFADASTFREPLGCFAIRSTFWGPRDCRNSTSNAVGRTNLVSPPWGATIKNQRFFIVGGNYKFKLLLLSLSEFLSKSFPKGYLYLHLTFYSAHKLLPQPVP